MKRNQRQEAEDEEWLWLPRRKEPRVPSYTLGDGLKWLRGPMIEKGYFGSVYLANLKKPKSRHSYLPPVMAVKSAEVSVSGSLQKEKEVFNNIQGCSYILKCFGEEITTDSNGQMVFNLLVECASGGDLGSLIMNMKSNGSGLPESNIRRYTRTILLGLKHIHDCKYVHCDLKPENILLVSTSADFSKFVAKIGDFGLTKRAKQNKKSRLDPYLRGSTVYMSPEAVIDNLQDQPSDIWALGCVVLEMFTGNPPWDRKQDESSHDVMSRIAREGALPNIPDKISVDGKAFLKACFERDAKSRPTSEMLLNHAFVAGLVGDIGEEVGNLEEAAYDEEEGSCSSPSLLEEDHGLDEDVHELADELETAYDEEEGSCSSLSLLEEDHGLDEDVHKQADELKAESDGEDACCSSTSLFVEDDSYSSDDCDSYSDEDSGKAFLKACFERDAKSRQTSEMLLNHPFVAGLVGDIGEEVGNFDEEEGSCSSPSLLEEDHGLDEDVHELADELETAYDEEEDSCSSPSLLEEDHGLDEDVHKQADELKAESDGEDTCCSSTSLFVEDDSYSSDDCDSYSDEDSVDSSSSTITPQ